MTKNDISIETYTLIAKAGILLGQMNPTKDPDRLVKAMINAMINKQCEACMNLGEDTNEGRN